MHIKNIISLKIKRNFLSFILGFYADRISCDAALLSFFLNVYKITECWKNSRINLLNLIWSHYRLSKVPELFQGYHHNVHKECSAMYPDSEKKSLNTLLYLSILDVPSLLDFSYRRYRRFNIWYPYQSSSSIYLLPISFLIVDIGLS